MGRLARQAFRRPVTDEDMAPLMRFYEKGQKVDSFEGGVRESIAAILVSPHFLYRAESAVDQGARALTDLELASRLAFFLWSSLPDEALLSLAEKGQLSKPEVLKAQVHRTGDLVDVLSPCPLGTNSAELDFALINRDHG